tara:strand:- start:191 stop:715 length:525 start_codon:yes stop_codon:yes gene_type:complete
MEIKKLSWLHRYQYDNLPNSYKELKKEFNTLNTLLNRKVKRSDKIKNEIVELRDEIRLLHTQHNSIFKKLEFINKNYTPNSYLTTYQKNNKGEYVQLIVKYLGETKSIYLGNKEKIIKTFEDYIPSLNEKNYKYKVGKYLEPIITTHFIQLNDPKSFLRNSYKLIDIVEVIKVK